MIGIADKDGKIIFHNRSFVERVGLDPTKEKAHVRDFHPEWALKKVIEEGIPAAQKKGSWTGETAVKTRSGEVFPTLQTIIWTDDGTDQPITSTIIKDISVLRDREDNLKREVQARLVAEKEAQKASIEKSLFLANMSHEIRTPLHSIIGLSDILLEENRDEDKEKPLKTLHKASHHLLGIVNDILDISKIQAGEIEIESRFMNPRKETEDLIEIFTYPAEEKGLNLILENKLEKKELFRGDKTRLRQILSNLISNAIKFTNSGHVMVEIKAPDSKHILWRVKDTGVGIEENNIDKIFSQFKQESAETKVPLKEEYNVLCVDDSEDNTFIIGKFLENSEFNPTIVHSGAEAISLFESKKYDLILMDTQMPDLDGNQATKQIRELEAKKEQEKTIIVAFSASATSEEIDTALKASHDSYLTKPVTKDKLLTFLRENLRPKEANDKNKKPTD